MSKTIIVNGYGPGISNAVAERFGSEGFTVALVARNAERLAAGVKALEAKNIRAQAFATDLSQPDAARAVVAKVRDALGPIDALHWNAYGSVAGDLTTASTSEVRAIFDVAIASLTAAIQAALPDLTARQGAVLVTNGGLGFFDAQVDQLGVEWNAMGLSIANSAKHKLVRLLALKLKAQGVFVGEVVVTGLVKGTPWDNGNATIDPKDIAAKFWQLHSARSDVSATI
jgi:NAD(P)-dependent dehydrogenase (short-subunit alcohol dehydrogenase family)